MFNPANFLEIAFLLLIAFLVGASVGSLARLAALRMRRSAAAPAVPTVVQPAPADGAETALVSAPVIDPVAKPATPMAPADVPTPDFAAAVQAIAEKSASGLMANIKMPSMAPLPILEAKKPKPEMAPAHVAGKTTSGIEVSSPVINASLKLPEAAIIGTGAEVIQFPAERALPPVQELPTTVQSVNQAAPETTPSVEPDLLSAAAPFVDTSDIAAIEPVAESELPVGTNFAEPTPEPTSAATIEGREFVVDVAAVASSGPGVIDAFMAEAAPESAAVVRDVTLSIAAPEEVAAPAPEAAAPLAPVADARKSSVSTDEDEAAAMRAIEGNWTPKRSASQRKRVAVDEVEAGDAVATATSSLVEEATAVVVELPGKPMSLGGPRQGIKDNLTNVIGILPIIETALNNAGIYHFDQVAEFTDENVAWLEGHLGIGGRIGREHWREQARELAIVSDRARKVVGKP